jgi:predicted porin
MNSRHLLFAVLSACAAAAHGQGVLYGVPSQPITGGEAKLDLRGGRSTVSLGLFEGASDGATVRLLEYADEEVEHKVQNFTRDTLRRRPEIDTFSESRLERRNRAWGMSLGFQTGPVAIRVAHQNKHVAKVTPAMALGNIMDAKNSILAASVNVGRAKVYAAYSANRGWGSSPLWNPDNPYSASLNASPSTDSRDLMTGVAVPFGATTFLASWIRKNDRDLANRDTSQFAFGASHALSRRTDFYAAYSHTTHVSGRGVAISRSGPGAADSAVSMGMRHSF